MIAFDGPHGPGYVIIAISKNFNAAKNAVGGATVIVSIILPSKLLDRDLLKSGTLTDFFKISTKIKQKFRFSVNFFF